MKHRHENNTSKTAYCWDLADTAECGGEYTAEEAIVV